jgi:hypothetical protein
MRINLFALLVLCFLIYSCNQRSGYKSEMREAWVPVYATNAAAIKTVTAGPARPTINAGKLYTVGSLIYQVEQDSGIHIISYANPAAPQKLGFIRSFMCKEVSVKNGLIYTNNFSDLVVINATDMNNVREVGRTTDVFPELALQYPPRPVNASGLVYFECPDPKKGVIVSWVKRNIDNAKCYR